MRASAEKRGIEPGDLLAGEDGSPAREQSRDDVRGRCGHRRARRLRHGGVAGTGGLGHNGWSVSRSFDFTRSVLSH